VSTLQTDPYLRVDPDNGLLQVLKSEKVECKLPCEFAEAIRAARFTSHDSPCHKVTMQTVTQLQPTSITGYASGQVVQQIAGRPGVC